MSKVRKISLLLTCTISIADSKVFGSAAPSLRTVAGGLRVLSIRSNIIQTYSYPVGTLPIQGFEPKVAMTLTDAEESDDFNWTASPSNSLIGTSFPGGGAPYVAMATLDSGGQTHLISYSDISHFDLSSLNRSGGHTSQLAGASGVEDADISDPLGVWVTGLSNVTSGTTASVNTATLKGQYNVSVLSAQTGSTLPNIVGLPMYAQHGVLIKNSSTIRRTDGPSVYRGPDISLNAQNPAANSPVLSGLTHKIALDLLDPNNSATSAPAFFPSFDNFNNLHDNPSTPTFWSFPFATVNFSHTGGTQSGQQFLFDTGAQVSILSEQMAANVGFDVASDTPDFTVQVAGVGGITNVPGFYMNSLTIPAVGGNLNFTNVPILVLNVTDPRDGIGFVPGIVGMNLFTDRNMFLNLNAGDPYVRISDAVVAKWRVNAGGNWSSSSNWQLGVPNGIDQTANLTDVISDARTVTLDVAATVGTLHFDNVNKFTINGVQTLTINSTTSGLIDSASGSHDINAPLQLNVNTSVIVDGAENTLKCSNLKDTAKTLSKEGAGTLEVNRVRASGLTITQGKVAISANRTGAGVSIVNALNITTANGAQLDLKDNGIVIKTAGARTAIRNLVESGKGGFDNNGSVLWNGAGIISSTARANNVPLSVDVFTIGVIRNGDLNDLLGPGSAYGPSNPWMGSVTNIGAEDILARYTYAGDTDLNGTVTIDDYNAIDGATLGLTTVNGWITGDFDYNGSITIDDYNAIDTGYLYQNGQLSQAMLAQRQAMFGSDYVAHLQLLAAEFAAVPEPTSVGLITLTACSLLGRRRRRIPQNHQHQQY